MPYARPGYPWRPVPGQTVRRGDVTPSQAATPRPPLLLEGPPPRAPLTGVLAGGPGGIFKRVAKEAGGPPSRGVVNTRTAAAALPDKVLEQRDRPQVDRGWLTEPEETAKLWAGKKLNPKDFPLVVENPSGMYLLNRHDWSGVKKKQVVKQVAKAIDALEGVHIVGLDVARTGTVYLEVGIGPWDAYYGLFGEGADRSIRISDHRSYAGAYSHDGRTDTYTVPDIEIKNAADIESMVSELTDIREKDKMKSLQDAVRPLEPTSAAAF